MKRFILLWIGILIIVAGLTGCNQEHTPSEITPEVTAAGNKPAKAGETAGTDTDLEADGGTTPDKKVINVWSNSEYMSGILDKFKELHPDFNYEINLTDLSFSDVDYPGVLDQALAAGGPEAPDLYSVEAPDVMRYTQGDAYSYAADYKALGMEIDTLLAEASIPKYFLELGTNPDGKLVSLSYQSTAAAFLYRRSIAKDVWGTEEPSVIRDIIGPGWEKFFTAAEALKTKGYCICSGAGDIWQAVENSADQGWIVDKKLVIDPKREAYLELAGRLIENGYCNNHDPWQEAWYNDMKDAGQRKVFGYFGPSWLLNYIITRNCGGKAAGEGTYGDWAVCEPPAGFLEGGTFILANKDTEEKAAVGELIRWMTLDTSETGLQYLWANGKLRTNVKDAVASAAVMKNSDGSQDIVGGQDIFDVYIPAGEYVKGTNLTPYDKAIEYYWLLQVREYTDGNKSKEQAISDFRKAVHDNIPGIEE